MDFYLRLLLAMVNVVKRDLPALAHELGVKLKVLFHAVIAVIPVNEEKVQLGAVERAAKLLANVIVVRAAAGCNRGVWSGPRKDSKNGRLFSL